MLRIVFVLTAALIAILLITLAFSAARPSRRIWPPAQQTWQFYFVWVPTLLTFLGLIIVGLLDWNSLGWPSLFRWTVGGGTVLAGNVLAWVGASQLTLRATSGAKGELVTDGLYRYSRNPQYIGDILILLGWTLWSASLWVAPLTLGGIPIFVLTPFAEEPWLTQIHGSAFKSYCQKVPRFLIRHLSRPDGTLT